MLTQKDAQVSDQDMAEIPEHEDDGSQSEEDKAKPEKKKTEVDLFNDKISEYKTRGGAENEFLSSTKQEEATIREERKNGVAVVKVKTVQSDKLAKSPTRISVEHPLDPLELDEGQEESRPAQIDTERRDETGAQRKIRVQFDKEYSSLMQRSIYEKYAKDKAKPEDKEYFITCKYCKEGPRRLEVKSFDALTEKEKSEPCDICRTTISNAS